MARKPKKPQPQQPEAPKGFDEFVDEAEGLDDDVVNVDPATLAPPAKQRDWRDVEKFKEERELRQLVEDDLDPLDDIGGGPRRRH